MDWMSHSLIEIKPSLRLTAIQGSPASAVT